MRERVQSIQKESNHGPTAGVAQRPSSPETGRSCGHQPSHYGAMRYHDEILKGCKDEQHHVLPSEDDADETVEDGMKPCVPSISSEEDDEEEICNNAETNNKKVIKKENQASEDSPIRHLHQCSRKDPQSNEGKKSLCRALGHGATMKKGLYDDLEKRGGSRTNVDMVINDYIRLIQGINHEEKMNNVLYNSPSRHCSGPASQEYQCLSPSQYDDTDIKVGDGAAIQCIITSQYDEDLRSEGGKNYNKDGPESGEHEAVILNTELRELCEAIEKNKHDVNVFCWLWRLSMRVTDETPGHLMQKMSEVHGLLLCRDVPTHVMDLVKEAGEIIVNWGVPTIQNKEQKPKTETMETPAVEPLIRSQGVAELKGQNNSTMYNTNGETKSPHSSRLGIDDMMPGDTRELNKDEKDLCAHATLKWLMQPNTGEPGKKEVESAHAMVKWMSNLNIDELTAFKNKHLAALNKNEREACGDAGAFIDSFKQRELRDVIQQKVDRAKENMNVWTPCIGNIVVVTGLEKAGEYNGHKGIVTIFDATTVRYGVQVKHAGKTKTILVRGANIIPANNKIEQRMPPSPQSEETAMATKTKTETKIGMWLHEAYHEHKLHHNKAKTMKDANESWRLSKMINGHEPYTCHVIDHRSVTSNIDQMATTTVEASVRIHAWLEGTRLEHRLFDTNKLVRDLGGIWTLEKMDMITRGIRWCPPNMIKNKVKDVTASWLKCKKRIVKAGADQMLDGTPKFDKYPTKSAVQRVKRQCPTASMCAAEVVASLPDHRSVSGNGDDTTKQNENNKTNSSHNNRHGLLKEAEVITNRSGSKSSGQNNCSNDKVEGAEAITKEEIIQHEMMAACNNAEFGAKERRKEATPPKSNGDDRSVNPDNWCVSQQNRTIGSPEKSDNEVLQVATKVCHKSQNTWIQVIASQIKRTVDNESDAHGPTNSDARVQHTAEVVNGDITVWREAKADSIATTARGTQEKPHVHARTCWVMSMFGSKERTTDMVTLDKRTREEASYDHRSVLLDGNEVSKNHRSVLGHSMMTNDEELKKKRALIMTVNGTINHDMQQTTVTIMVKDEFHPVQERNRLKLVEPRCEYSTENYETEISMKRESLTKEYSQGVWYMKDDGLMLGDVGTDAGMKFLCHEQDNTINVDGNADAVMRCNEVDTNIVSNRTKVYERNKNDVSMTVYWQSVVDTGQDDALLPEYHSENEVVTSSERFGEYEKQWYRNDEIEVEPYVLT